MSDKEKFLSCIDDNSKTLSIKAINKEFNCGLKGALIWYEAFVKNKNIYISEKYAFCKFFDMTGDEYDSIITKK